METADAMKNLEQVTSTALLEKLGKLFSDAGFELALTGHLTLPPSEARKVDVAFDHSGFGRWWSEHPC